MITRKEYMQDSMNLHNAYYSQFVTPELIEYLDSVLGERIRKSDCKYFNDIPLARWDRLQYTVCILADMNMLYESKGSRSISLSETCCIAKAAASMIRDTQPL